MEEVIIVSKPPQSFFTVTVESVTWQISMPAQARTQLTILDIETTSPKYSPKFGLGENLTSGGKCIV